MSVFAVDKLMEQTRRLAAEYYQTTKQTLPVSTELAKYDASRLLDLTAPEQPIAGIDAIDKQGNKIQIKSRVIFKEGNAGYRIGQMNVNAEWDVILLVLMDKDYHPFEIYSAPRHEIEAVQNDKPNLKRGKRGAMSVAKFKAISELLWVRK